MLKKIFFPKVSLSLLLSLFFSVSCKGGDNPLPVWQEPYLPSEVALNIARLTTPIDIYKAENEAQTNDLDEDVFFQIRFIHLINSENALHRLRFSTRVEESTLYRLSLCMGVEKPDSQASTLYNLRLTSQFWKKIADDILIRERLIYAYLTPSNYLDPVLHQLAYLISSVFFVDWRDIHWQKDENSNQLKDALTVCFFPNAHYIFYLTSDNFQLKSQRLDAEGTISFTAGLSSFPKLKSLYLDGVNFGDQGGEVVGYALKNLSQLEYIYLCGKAGPLGIYNFTKGLKHSPNLKTLILRGYGVGDVGSLAIAKKLKYLPKLSTLSLSYVYCDDSVSDSSFITNLGFHFLATKISKHLKHSLSNLVIMHHFLDDKDVESLQKEMPNLVIKTASL